MIQSYGYGSGVAASIATYQANFSVTPDASGTAVEILGSASTTVKIREIYFYKPSTTITLTITKRSTAATGGTSSNATLVPLIASSSAATAVVKLYTTVPNGGSTAVGTLFTGSVTAADVLAWTWGDLDDQQLTLSGVAQALTLGVSATCTIYGYVKFTEE